MANIGGYKGVLLAAAELNKYFPMFMTAAGMVPPAKVFVIGAGVAGLQAIATAKRLGAVVKAYDVRAAAAEEIRSMGAVAIDHARDLDDVVRCQIGDRAVVADVDDLDVARVCMQ